MIRFLYDSIMAVRRLKRLTEKEKGLIIGVIKDWLRSREEVVFALLFGSMVNPVLPDLYGDIDIAVYIRSERLDRAEYILEAHLEAEASQRLSAAGFGSSPVEITIVNRAPYPFLLSLFKNPYLVLKKDDDALSDFIEEVSGRALANSYFRRESLREVLEA